jgi:hypothetical protein
MKQAHFAHIDSRVYHVHAHEVRLHEKPDPGLFGSGTSSNKLDLTYAALAWLQERGWQQLDNNPGRWDWDLHMHGGEMGYTSFWFREASKAIEFKLVWAGVEAR